MSEVRRILVWVPYPNGMQVTETVVLAADYDSLLAVLRQCVRAMRKAEPTVVWGGAERTVLDEYEAALSSACPYIERKEGETPK